MPLSRNRRNRHLILTTLAALICVASPAANPQTPPTSVDYLVSIADIPHRRFHITETITGVTAPAVSVAIPAWSPGWYVLTHAYRNIRAVTATDAQSGNALEVMHPDQLTWRIRCDDAHSVAISYDVIAEDRDPDALDIGTPATKSYGFFAPYLDETNGFVPGPATLLYVVDGKTVPCRVTYRVPAGWKIASANAPTADPATFTAPDYDTLADQPADLGRFRRVDRTIDGVPVSVVVVGGASLDPTRWIDDTFLIARAGIEYWGKDVRPPFPRYIFQFRFPTGENGGGGLEHLNGAVITLNPSVLKDVSREDLELIAHEFFHAWNVKRARPEKLGPFDYTGPVRVKELWWAEGVTDYIAPHLLVEAGLADPLFWREFVGAQINTLQNNDARRNVTLESASLNAWEGRSEGFGGLSYYNKGLVVGLLLDIELRHRTGNKIGLDDLMKALFQESVKTGHGYPEGEIERLATRLAGSDFSAFFDRALRSTDELPYDVILPEAGLRLDDEITAYADLGFDSEFTEGLTLLVDSVVPTGPAAAAGLQNGDQIIAGGGKNISQTESRLTNCKPGDALDLWVRRGGRVEHLHLTVGRRTEHVYSLSTVRSATPEQKAILAAISGGN